MSGVYLTGMASGLDTDSIVSALISVEKAGRKRLEFQQAAAEARQTNLADLKTKLGSLKGAAADLRSVTSWLDTQTVGVSDGAKAAVKLSGGAGPGGYELTVTQMASAERRTYAYSPPSGASQLSILNADGTPRTTIDLAGGATLDDAVRAINSASAAAGVYAVNVGGELVLSSRTTGAAGGFSLAGAGAQTAMVAGQDATGTIDGLPFQSATNVLTGAIPGVEISLKAKTTDPVTVTVGNPGPDTAKIKDKIKAFITAYNAVVTATQADLSEQRVPKAATAADAAKGSLFGDTGLSSMLSSMRSLVGSPVAGATGLTKLSELGISTGSASAVLNPDALSGKLVLDEAKLDQALTSDPLGVRKLLGGAAGIDGFGQAMEALVGPLTASGGMFDSRATAVTSDLKRIKDNLTRFDDRMSAKEAFLKAQYAALETALSKSNSLSSALAGQLNSLSSSSG